jgi:hypothetical protein
VAGGRRRGSIVLILREACWDFLKEEALSELVDRYALGADDIYKGSVIQEGSHGVLLSKDCTLYTWKVWGAKRTITAIIGAALLRSGQI